MARRPIAYLLLICYLPACTTWHIERGISPARVIANQRPDSIRVTRTDSSRLVLVQPNIAAGDSVTAIYNGYRARIALSDITTVETKRFNAGATFAGAFVVSMVAIVVAFSAFKGAWKDQQ